MIERSKRIELRVTSEELKQIRERMQETGISSLTAYMIRMAIHGYVLKMDFSDLKELLRIMQIAGNNLNQYAKKANETGSIYREDIEELRTAQKEILQEMRKVLEKLTGRKVSVGGIAATMLPKQIYEETGIMPVCGLLNEPGKLGLPGDECIDQIVPDYSMLDDIDYVYPFNDAYFLSATKGCGNKCGFCAVQTLEPTFVPYIDIREKIRAIDEEFGPKKDLILMDNNVLRSPRFDDIIDDIIAAGFAKGATYKNPRTGKVVQRYVDFNQGLDALFLNEAKAKRLGEIALKPARVAFDHIEDRDIYERALRLCAKNGITELSNYVLYNSEDFGGKGKKYHADTPEDLYDRMRITLDLKDEINSELPDDCEKVAAFSFPMRYIPLSAHERGYVGSMWNAKYLRAIQRMLVPTQGKGVCSRSFFEADFGKSSDEFVRYLSKGTIFCHWNRSILLIQ